MSILTVSTCIWLFQHRRLTDLNIGLSAQNVVVHCAQEKLVKEGFAACTGLGSVNHTHGLLHTSDRDIWCSNSLTQVDNTDSL